jgi:superfamily I DNA/RNA helicase
VVESELMNGYRLVRRELAARPAPPASLDEAQQRVVDHKGGPMLVLAGPGTGKTTTIVAAVAERIERRGTDPGRILVLTFSRKAAGELRDRITARLGRTTSEPLALTFHSYAYALVRREFVLAGDEPPRLLSAPEQLLEIRRLLRGEVTDGAAGWPDRFRPALATRGFAEELRDLVLRAAERGLDGKSLRQLGRAAGRDDWVAAGAFLDRYSGRFDLAPVPAYDYAEIVRIAASLLTRQATRQREQDAYDAVFVDEYQDCDPAQEALLRALAGDGRDLVAVGDPDQSVYAFRGADVRVLTSFPDKFRGPDGAPAPVTALRTCRRSGPVLLAASRRVARRLPAAPGGDTAAHRRLAALPGGPAGQVRICVADTQAQEAAVVADTLRRAHLADGVPWERMAVLVRSAQWQVPALRRALTAAGVPVTVAGDELPLPDEPGVRPLLTLLRCAVQPDRLDDEAAAELLTGPLGQTDSLGLRRLRRALDGVPLREALTDPRVLQAVRDRVAAPARRVAALLDLAARGVDGGASAEDVLWSVWNESGLAVRWAGQAEQDSAADRDLDAVLALFEAAARFSDALPPGHLPGARPPVPPEVQPGGEGRAYRADRLPGARPPVPPGGLPGGAARVYRAGHLGLFLESLAGQEIAGDTLAEHALREDCVRLLTAHRAKGLEWDVVVVAGVQEEVWPDLRLRNSLLGADELAEVAGGSGAFAGGSVQGPGAPEDVAAAARAARLLAEERRLFYVAVTRARKLLMVTASGGDEHDQRPSRFLAELAGDDIEIERASAATRWLSLPALVADLRRTSADPAMPAVVREAAARQLARLADAGVRGADPADWYALTGLSDAGPIVGDGERVRLSPSHVETFTRCGLRWLLESAVGAGHSDVLRHLGTVIHAAAQLIADGATEGEVAGRIDDIWHHLDFGSVWYGTRQRELAERMVRKFLDWHEANPRELLAAEQALRVQVGQVEITGRVDRLERDDQGRGVIVDLKTGASAPHADELDRHPQLGVYQLAVLLGAFERLGVTEPGGAELVQVGKAGLTARARVQRQTALADDQEPGWARNLVDAVAEGMAGPVYRARVNPGCRTCPVASCCPVHPDGGEVGG